MGSVNDKPQAINDDIPIKKNKPKIRKRYKLGLESINEKKLVLESFDSFDRSMVIKKLKEGYRNDEKFHLKISSMLRNLIRVHNLVPENLNFIWDDIINREITYSTRLNLSQIIKHSLKIGGKVDFKHLIILIEKCNDFDIKSEILYALAYQLKKTPNEECSEFLENILRVIEETEISENSRNFLKTIIRDKFINLSKTIPNNINFTIRSINKNPMIEVTRNQIKNKTQLSNHKSEEEVLENHNILDALKERISERKNIIKEENFPKPVDDDFGSNKKIWRTTYMEIKSLYKDAIDGSIIKSEDKDNYLVTKLLFDYKYLSIYDSTSGFIINKMIVNTFLLISKRTENRQFLHRNCLDVLFDLVESENEKSFQVKDLFDFFSKIYHGRIWVPSNSEIKLESDLGETLKILIDKYKTLHRSKCKIDDNKEYACLIHVKEDIRKDTEAFITKEIAQIKQEAIEAIYHNLISGIRQDLISKYEVRLMKLTYSNDEIIKKYAVKIIFASNRDTTSIHDTFTKALTLLKNGNEVQEAIDYIMEQVMEPQRCQQLECDYFRRILNLLNLSLKDGTKLDIMRIINKHLEYSFNKGLDSWDLDKMIKILSKIQNYAIKFEILISILLTADKNKSLPKGIVEQLILIVNKMDNDKCLCLIMMILYKVNENTTIEQIDKLYEKLNDQRVIVGKGTNLYLEERSNKNNSYMSVSYIVANTILEMVKNNIKLEKNILDNLISCIFEGDKQTQIVCAKIFYLLSLKKNVVTIPEEILQDLRDCLIHNLADVSFYSTFAYTRGLKNLVKNGRKINQSHCEYLVAIYTFGEFRLEQLEISKLLNKNILFLLEYYADKFQFDEEVFKIVDLVLRNDEMCEKKKCLYILEKHTYNYFIIPKETLQLIENCMAYCDLLEIVSQVFENSIIAGQPVPEKPLFNYVDDLYLSDNNNFHSQKILEQAKHNQELSEEIFFKIIQQNAGQSIWNNKEDISSAICFIKNKTEEGLILSKFTIKAVIQNILKRDVIKKNVLNCLDILLNITKYTGKFSRIFIKYI